MSARRRFSFTITTARSEKLTQDQAASQKQIGDLTKRMQSAEADSETLAHQLGMTKKELATRASELQRQQQAASARIAAQAEQEKKDVNAVSGEVGSVKTDVGGVKTDVAATKASLEATISKLQSTVGDLNVQSGLIANTRTDLEALKHKGDRQYYEFTLLKGAKPQAFSTVALAAEEDRSETRQVLAERHRRRQDHREKRQKPERAGTVLYRTRSHAL